VGVEKGWLGSGSWWDVSTRAEGSEVLWGSARAECGSSPWPRRAPGQGARYQAARSCRDCSDSGAGSATPRTQELDTSQSTGKAPVDEGPITCRIALSSSAPVAIAAKCACRRRGRCTRWAWKGVEILRLRRAIRFALGLASLRMTWGWESLNRH